MFRIPVAVSRRHFLGIGARSLLGLGLGSFLPSVFGGAPKASAAEGLDAFFVRQLVAQDNAVSRAIAWNSAVEEAEAVVDVRLAANGQDIASVPARETLFADDGEQSFSHTALLTGLAPGTSYEYRLRTGDTATAWLPLQTAERNTCKALIFPDSQCSDDYRTWRAAAENTAARHPDAAFFIMMGDLVDNGESSYQWRQWFAGAAGLIRRLPCAPLMGNHETYDLGWKCRLPHAWLNYFPMPGNASARFYGWYYSFDWGPCHFAALNTQWEEVDALRPGLLAEQAAWLRTDLAASRKPWKIVLMHKDVIEYDYPDPADPVTGDISTTGRALMPLFDELRPAVVLTAHQHTYRRLGRILRFAPAADGPLYIDTGNCGNCYYDVPQNPRFDEKMLAQPERGNYMTLEASKEHLHLRCYLPDGTLADEAALDHPAPSASKAQAADAGSAD